MTGDEDAEKTLTDRVATPDPEKTRTSPPPADFGFEPHEVEFIKQGIGGEAASRLARQFRLIQEINSGGMGKVILVQEVLSGRFVAMKIMLERATADASLVQQFIREAIITARLQHPHIIPVHDLGFLEGNHLYFTMRYVDGQSFKAAMAGMELAERVRVVRGAALAAAHAHALGLWHRDIKPHNILVGPLGDTYLIDWGLVSVQRNKEYKLNIPRIVVERFPYTIPDNLIDNTASAITASNQYALGTPAYMSPEQVTKDDLHMGAVSDVWSLGVVLFEALTGRHPIADPGSTPLLQMFARILADPVPAPSDLVDGIPQELDELCQRMLNKDPTQRVGSASEVVDRLTKILKAYPFGTIAILPGSAAYVNAHLETTPWSSEPTPGLRQEVTQLTAEVERLREKNRILAQLTQLSWFHFGRRRDLMIKLATL